LTILYEHRRGKHRRDTPTLVPADALKTLHGFQSVFGYPPETAGWVKKHGSTKGMKHATVYCDTILVDYDDEPEVAEAAILYLRNHGHRFTVWDSGNRSVHLHVALEPIEGVWVPGAVKQWVRQYLRPSDLSFYHAAGMYRLPGTVHEKTGRAKVQTAEYQGNPVVIEYTKEAVTVSTHKPTGDVTELRHRYQINLITPAGTGRRSTHISCCLARDARALGLTLEQATADIQEWNRRFATPAHSPDTVAKKVRYEYTS